MINDGRPTIRLSPDYSAPSPLWPLSEAVDALVPTELLGRLKTWQQDFDEPELPGAFLQDSVDDDFFVQTAETATDMWRVDVEGLWLESGPSGWWLVSEPIDRERLELLPPMHGAEDPWPS